MFVVRLNRKFTFVDCGEAVVATVTGGHAASSPGRHFRPALPLFIVADCELLTCGVKIRHIIWLSPHTDRKIYTE